jgi:hypothetical protein
MIILFPTLGDVCYSPSVANSDFPCGFSGGVVLP